MSSISAGPRRVYTGSVLYDGQVDELTRERLLCAAIAVATMLAACSRVPSSSERSPDATVEPVGTEMASTSSAAEAVVVGKVPVTNAAMQAIVILEPRHSVPMPEPAMMPYMDQLSRNFIPSILIVRTGRPVEFRNSDEELHNINVKDGGTREQAFNVAVPPAVNYVHTFERSGVYDVSCDAHPSMSAQIVAASTPYVALTDPDGRFEIPHVIPGRYAVTVYAGAEPIEKTIEVTGSRTEIDLTLR